MISPIKDLPLFAAVHKAVRAYFPPPLGTEPHDAFEALNLVASQIGLDSVPTINPAALPETLEISTVMYRAAVEQLAYELVSATDHGLKLGNVIGQDVHELRESVGSALGTDVSTLRIDPDGTVTDFAVSVRNFAMKNVDRQIIDLGFAASAQDIADSIPEGKAKGNLRTPNPDDADLIDNVVRGLTSGK